MQSSYSNLNPRSCSTSTICHAADLPSPAAATASSHPPNWRPLWRTFLDRLYDAGHFKSDPHIGAAGVESDPAATKRAVLSFSRQRPDILDFLSLEKITALVKAGLPEGEASDRKSRNAYRRLEASFIAGQPLSAGDGGPADLQDVLRMVLALANAVDAGEPEEALHDLAIAAGNLLPEVLQAMDLPPPEGAKKLSPKAENMQRLNTSKKSNRGGDAKNTPWSRSKFNRP